MNIEEFLKEIEDKSPPAPQDKLENLEKKLGVKLPEEYRDFLIKCNGGYVGGRYWYTDEAADGKYIEVGVHHIGGFRDESYFSLESSLESYQHPEEPRIPKELLWIMDDPFGNATCIGLKGEYRGKIYFWDHENEPDPDEWDGKVETAENIRLVTNTFLEFVAGLRTLDYE